MEHIVDRFDLIRPVLPTYLHLLVSALFPIYAGAHASLTRPSSAAKPPKREKHGDHRSEQDDTEEDQQKMEGLSPSDAIMFPVMAGCTLAGLYFIIRWLEDPALLNIILNWYFSVFGVLSVARLLTDAMGVLHSYIFPGKYAWNSRLWEVRRGVKKTESLPDRSMQISTPLPGLLSKLPLPGRLKSFLWTLQGLPSQKLDIRIYIHKITSSRFHLGPQGVFGLVIALAAISYYNLYDKPWWLTNLLGFGFAYSVLQIMSPTTFWTGTLILGSLFFYDIYFVFFTPLMVTVATKLDIPAKLLFPRPSGPEDDPSKQALSMLGLGDVVLPGIMIGLALRFDLYLFYLRKQQRKTTIKETETDGKPSDENTPGANIVKAKWQPATGGWGERFWVGNMRSIIETQQHSGNFPKPYFHAGLVGYSIGMLCTLGIMHAFKHAQPALLYLVPGVLISLWGTALVKGDVKTMWEYTEAEDEDSAVGKKGEEKKKGKGMESIFSHSRQEKMSKRLEAKIKGANDDNKVDDSESKTGGEMAKKGPFEHDRKNELVFFSITLPQTSSENTKDDSTKSLYDKSTSQKGEQDESIKSTSISSIEKQNDESNPTPSSQEENSVS